MPESVLDKLYSPEDTELQIPPINEAVVKVHSRCNYDCSYCYVYSLGDESWREQPKLMTDQTMDTFAGRLGEYLGQTQPLGFQVTFHGGEPLLAPPEFFQRSVTTLRAAAGAKTVLQFAVQTNGSLLSEDHLKVFRQNHIGVGVSLDGTKETNDRQRVDRQGNSTYEATTRGIQRMVDDDRFAHLFQGILSVVDIQSDPVETYKELLQYRPPSVDFLLPHGNWETPPPGLGTELERHSRPYGAWMSKVFDEWFPDGTMALRIRTFDSIMHLLSGQRSNVESIGGQGEAGLVVVETDGSYELVDTLKSTPGRVAKTGKNVYRHSLEEANQYMAKQAKRLGITALAEACQKCPIVAQCGGGYAPHRYSEANGFQDRSVYCLDIATMVSRIYGSLNQEALINKIDVAISDVEPRFLEIPRPAQAPPIILSSQPF